MNCALSGTFVTEAELPKGMATADGDYALGCRSASALQLDARKLAGLVALSEDLGHDGSERLIVEPLQPAPQLSSVERPPKSPRRSAPDTSMSTATSSAEAYDEGHGATQRGRADISEARPALLTLPSEAALMETGQDDRPETPQSIMAIKEPAVYETIIEPTLWGWCKDERGHFTLEFRRKVVEHALRLPATARVRPTCRAYAASGIAKDTLKYWLRKEGVPPQPKYTHSCKQCPRAGPCKKGAGCTRRDQCEHMHQRHACRRGLCPARQLNAKAGYGYYTDDEIVAVLRRAPPPRFCIKALPLGSRRVSWPMGMPTSGEALRHAMKPAAGPGRRVHAPSSLGL
jgi:hypothetical protein